MRRNNRGFTLGELMTSTAILATLAVLTVPHYLRYKMDTNMELVRQHMRIISEKMVEIYNRENKFPEMSNWPGNLTANEDEMTLTASLSAIDDYCYTTNDYFTSNNGQMYRFCTAPKTAACGKYAGTKRFCVHYSADLAQYFAVGAVGEIEASDSFGVNGVIGTMDGLGNASYLNEFLETNSLSMDEKAEYLTNTVLMYGYYMDFMTQFYLHDQPGQFTQDQLNTLSNYPLSTLLRFSPEFNDTYMSLLQGGVDPSTGEYVQGVYDRLKATGADFYQNVPTRSVLEDTPVMGVLSYYNDPDGHIYNYNFYDYPEEPQLYNTIVKFNDSIDIYENNLPWTYLNTTYIKYNLLNGPTIDDWGEATYR